MSKGRVAAAMAVICTITLWMYGSYASEQSALRELAANGVKCQVWTRFFPYIGFGRPPFMGQIHFREKQLSSENMHLVKRLRASLTLTIEDTELDAHSLRELSRNRLIDSLRIINCALPEDSIDALMPMSLTSLWLENTRVSGSSLRALRSSTLWDLSLMGTGIDDDALTELYRCPNLTFLDLKRTRVTGNALASIARMPAIVGVEISEVTVSGKQMRELHASKTLDSIFFMGCTLDADALEAAKDQKFSIHRRPLTEAPAQE